MNFDIKQCNLEQLGTGLTDCIQKLGYPKGFIKTSRNFSESTSTVLNREYFETKIQEGVFVPFLGADNNDLPVAEDVTQELPNGVQRIVRSGKPVFNFGYMTGGYYLHKIFSSYKGNNFGKVLLVFENGTILAVMSQDKTTWSGFDAGMFTSQYTANTGSEDEQVTAIMQITNTEQFENLGTILDSESLGFNPNDLTGVIDTEVTVTAAPVAATGQITATVKALFNKGIDIEGLLATDFRVLLNGVEDTITAVTFINGAYEIDITSALVAADEVVVELYDDALELVTVKVGDQFYKGVSKVFEVPA